VNIFVVLATHTPRRTLAVTIALGIVAVIVGSSTPKHLTSNENEFFSNSKEVTKANLLLTSYLRVKTLPNLGLIFPAHDSSDRRIIGTVQRVATLIPRVFHSQNKHTVAMIGYVDPKLPPGPTASDLVTRLRRFPHVMVGGTALFRQQFVSQVSRDLTKAAIVAFPLLLLIALSIFRSVVAALLPILTGGLTLGITLLGLRAINAIHPLSILSLDMVSVGLGLSLDYSILHVYRYREELAKNLDPIQASLTTLLTAGRTVMVSSAIVTAAFASLFLFPINFLRSIAISGMLTAATAGLISLIVLPAAFSVLGYRINALTLKRWRRSAERTAHPSEKGFWYRLSRLVITRPMIVAVIATSVLLTMGTPILNIRLTGFEALSLSETGGLHQIEERIRTEFNDPLLLGNVIVIVHGNRHTMHRILSRYMEKLPNVASGGVAQIKRTTWMFNIKTLDPPFSGATMQLVSQVHAIPGHLNITGVSSEFFNTELSLQSHLLSVVVLLITSTLILLFIATGSVILPFKAIVMSVLSLTAAFGLLVFVFQDGRFEGLLNYHSLGALPLTQPILICAATFGISTDYSVFMLTRIKEGWDSGLPNDEAVAMGVERTGRVISAAALLFCIAVGTPIIGKLIFVKEAAFGIAVVVAIDATIVRAFLVPSLMSLLGSWNWWPEISHLRDRKSNVAPRPAR
jgi:uncharacterized membrane protein YdfJ with MMPL/SSD domain